MRFLIIGGSDAGISAALRAQELNPEVEINVLLKDDCSNYSIFGLPFYLSGETPDWHSLAHRTALDGLSIHRQHRATQIDPVSKTVAVQIEDQDEHSFPYDKLLIGMASQAWSLKQIEQRRETGCAK